MDNNKKYKFYESPKMVGGYDITGGSELKIIFSMNKKPSYINRLFCKWCLGWVWNDEK